MVLGSSEQNKVNKWNKEQDIFCATAFYVSEAKTSLQMTNPTSSDVFTNEAWLGVFNTRKLWVLFI